VLRAKPEPDESYVRPFSLGHGTDFHDVDLACDHIVAELRHDVRKQLEAVAPFVRDQYAEVLRLVLNHPRGPNQRDCRHVDGKVPGCDAA
jgi:hypothetical protein